MAMATQPIRFDDGDAYERHMGTWIGGCDEEDFI
jgi:hypothetical protein